MSAYYVQAEFALASLQRSHRSDRSTTVKKKKTKRNAEGKLRSKEAWFAAGTAAFERVFPGARARVFPEFENPYISPLCRKPFVYEALANGTLTFEDAPPKSYGGKPVALTCKPCNNAFGSSVDASLARYDSQFVSPCTITLGGVQVNAYQEIHPRGRNVSIPQKQNDPKAVERFNAVLDTRDPTASGQPPADAEMGSDEASAGRCGMAQVRLHGGIRHLGLHVRVHAGAEDRAASARPVR